MIFQEARFESNLLSDLHKSISDVSSSHRVLESQLRYDVPLAKSKFENNFAGSLIPEIKIFSCVTCIKRAI